MNTIGCVYMWEASEGCRYCSMDNSSWFVGTPALHEPATCYDLQVELVTCRLKEAAGKKKTKKRATEVEYVCSLHRTARESCRDQTT